MSKLVIAIAALVCACGTKQNPRACCTDPADCMNVGLPVGTDCDEGLLCRGNRCVEDPCSSSAECDVTAPYCIETDEGRCSEACTIDTQCPGFGQTAEQTFCVDGGCAECRAGMNDCPANAPICSTAGMCVTCEAHTDCASGVCDDGACASESEIAFVATNGSPSSDCTRSLPCNGVSRVMQVVPAKQFVLIDPGTYTSNAAIELTGVRTLIGRGATRPVLTRSTNGPILRTVTGVDIKIEHIEIFGARGTVNPDKGIGIQCAFSASKFELDDVALRMNEEEGYKSLGCALTARRSLFEGNGRSGVSLIDSNGSFDSCMVIGNGNSGLHLDAGVFSVVNTFVVRNVGTGISLYSVGNGNTIAFNTIADNGFGGFECNVQGGGTGSFVNNIFVRNTPYEASGECAFANSITDANAGPLKFVRPDSAPYDYHLLPGSSALDLGSTVPNVTTDYDGEARVSGTGPDIGADELH